MMQKKVGYVIPGAITIGMMVPWLNFKILQSEKNSSQHWRGRAWRFTGRCRLTRGGRSTCRDGSTDWGTFAFLTHPQINMHSRSSCLWAGCVDIIKYRLGLRIPLMRVSYLHVWSVGLYLTMCWNFLVSSWLILEKREKEAANGVLISYLGRVSVIVRNKSFVNLFNFN